MSHSIWRPAIETNTTQVIRRKSPAKPLPYFSAAELIQTYLDGPGGPAPLSQMRRLARGSICDRGQPITEGRSTISGDQGFHYREQCQPREPQRATPWNVLLSGIGESAEREAGVRSNFLGETTMSQGQQSKSVKRHKQFERTEAVKRKRAAKRSKRAGKAATKGAQ